MKNQSATLATQTEIADRRAFVPSQEELTASLPHDFLAALGSEVVDSGFVSFAVADESPFAFIAEAIRSAYAPTPRASVGDILNVLA